MFNIHCKELGFQRGQFVFLTRICERPGLQLIELTHLTRVDKTTTTRAVSKLISKGYVVHMRDAHDRRAWNLFPTKKGRSMYKKIIAEENVEAALCFSNFTVSEKKQLAALLYKVIGNIDSAWFEIKNYRQEVQS